MINQDFFNRHCTVCGSLHCRADEDAIRECEYNRTDNLRKIELMSKFEEDWNGNGGRAFTEKAISRFREVIKNIIKHPKIAPTGRNSLYMEFRKGEDDVLAFEVCEDEVVVAKILGSTGTQTKIFSDFINGINKEIGDFFKENCKYKMEVPDKFVLCRYYHDNVKINNRIYAHFPKCGEGLCPLLNVND